MNLNLSPVGLVALVLAVAALALAAWAFVRLHPARIRERHLRAAMRELRPMGPGRGFSWGEFAAGVGRGILRRMLGRERPLGRAVWSYELIGPDGTVREAGNLGQNLIVDAGLDLVKDRLHNPASVAAGTGYMGIGTGAVPEVAGDTTLGSEVAAARGAVTYTAGGVGTCTVERTYPAAGGYEPVTITEAALFNAAVGGTMFNRKVFPAVIKTATDQLKVTCVITWSSA